MSTVPLRHLATVANSNVDKLSSEDELAVRLCNYVDVYKNDRITNDMPFMTATATQSEINKFRLRVDDIIITKDSEDRNDIAVPAYVEETADDLVCGYHLALLRAVNDRANGRFLFWALQAKHIREAFSLAAGGVTRFGLTLDGIKSVHLPCPNLPTQERIADYLDGETTRIDRLIEKKRAQMNLLREKQISETTHLVTRGVNSEQLRPTNLEWLPKAPNPWTVQRIANLFSESMEMGGDDLPILSVSINWGISDRELGDEDRHRIVSHIEDRNAYKRVRPGDLVYNMMRAWQGGFGVAKVDGLVSPAYVVARPRAEIHSPYFEALLRTPMCIEEFRRASKGIADFRQRLYWEHFRQVRVVLPPLEQQISIAEEIAERAKRIERMLAPIEKSIELLVEKRVALITAAVTGQLAIPEIVSIIEAPPDNVIPFVTRIAAQIIHHHRNTQRFGRVKLQKELYLAEAHAGVLELRGQYERRAAGPLDQALLGRLEAGLEKAALFRAQSDGPGEPVAYQALSKVSFSRADLEGDLGDRAETFFNILDKLSEMDTKSVEAVATLYAVWNDALIDDETPDDDRIVHGVLEEWHPEKKRKFKADELRTWLGWMRRNEFVPKGQGPSTKPWGLL